MKFRHFDFGPRALLLVFCFRLLSPATTGAASSEAPVVVAATNKSPWRLGPGRNDGQIAYWTAQLLGNNHYLQHRFDEEISSRFLDRYIELLDSQHLHFLQSDLARFERYRTNLARLTLTPSQSADTSPAFEIFACFYQRLQQHVDYVDEVLKNEKFEFNTDERIAVDRRDAPNPRTLDEAKALWRLRLRYDYLQEKLGLDAKKNQAGSTNAAGHNGQPPRSIHQQIADKLSHRYHRTLKIFTDWDNEDVMGYYLTALARVYDPHSDYFNRAQLESFKISMNLELFGIGAQLRADEDGYCKIEKLLPGGPAIKSKLIKPGDRIVAVAQSNQPPVDVVDMILNKVVQLIRGPKDTEVRLTLMPEGANSAERTVVTLIRDQIPLEDQAAKSRIIEQPDGKGGQVRLGIIDLPSFYAPMESEAGRRKRLELASTEAGLGHYTSVDVRRLLNKFKQENVSGVILDLRGNGGGSLVEAIRLTGLFIKEGPIVQAREYDDNRQVHDDDDPSVQYEGPLIVLTSRFSASASEILAAALQDYGRALIVGDSSTHGKGTVQTVSYLSQLLQTGDPDPDKFGAVKFTIRKFYRPSGASTQLKGVLPDIVLPSRLNYAKDIGESALENPLPDDRPLQKLRFERLDLVQPYLSELLRRSTERVATNQDFVYVREDIEEYRKYLADKSISLNENQRLQEQEREDARQKAREKELRARPEPQEKVYEISLKQSELPGLPPPLRKTNAPALKIGRGGDALGTNTVSIAQARPVDRTELANPDDLEKPSMPDADMNEARRILLDYILLLSRDRGVTGAPAPKPAG